MSGPGPTRRAPEPMTLIHHPHSVIRTAIMAMAVLVVVLAAYGGWWTYTEFRETHRILDSDRLAHASLSLASAIARERGWSSAILGAGPDSPRLAARMRDARSRTDARWKDYRHAVARWNRGSPPEGLLQLSLARVDRMHKTLLAARKHLDRFIDGEPARLGIEGWFRRTSRLNRALMDVGEAARHAVALPPETARFFFVRQLVWKVTEFAGRQRGLMAYYLAGDRPVPPRVRARLERFQGLSTSSAQRLATLNAAIGSPSIRDAVRKTGRKFFAGFENLRSRVMGAASSGKYPVGAREWFVRASSAIESVLEVSRVATTEIRSRVGKQAQSARRRLAAAGLVLGCTVLLAAIGVVQVRAAASTLSREEERAEAELRTNRRLLDILEASPDFIGMADPQGRLIYHNPAARKYLAGPEGEARPQHISDLHPEWASRRVLEIGLPTADRDGYWHGETAICSPDGEEIPFSQIIVAHYGLRGGVERYSTVGRDIREQKRAEAELRLHATVFENAAEGITVTDASSRILAVNRAFTEVTGYAPEEAIGQTPQILNSGVHGPEFYRDLWDTLQSRGLWRGEIWNRRKTGEIYPEHLTISAVPDAEGRVQQYVGIFTDISELKTKEEDLRRAKEAAEAASRAKSAFLANMSHEIRTPMTGILGAADFLADSELDPEERTDLLEVIRRNGHQLLRLIDDILHLSKLEARRLPVEPVPTSLAQVVQEVVTDFGIQARQEGLDLVHSFSFPLPAQISTDPLRLRQILSNLLANAIKFTESGAITVSAGMVSPNGETDEGVFVAVSDQGPGIPPEEQGRIFEPFDQAGDAEQQSRGTGLGLAISRGLAERLGGRLTLSSVPGEGSTFTVILDPGPLEGINWLRGEADLPGSSGADSGENRGLPALQGRILLGEDSPDTRVLLSTLLRNAGLSVTVAEDGRQVVEEAQRAERAEAPYDLIIMDVRMPVMDGNTATAALREAGVPSPILGLTAQPTEEEQQTCLAAGCNEVLPKPPDRHQLLYRLAVHLGQASPEEAGGSAGTIDTEVLERRREELGEVFGEWIGAFLQTAPERIEAMRDALAAGDAPTLKEEAHALKGSGANLGARGMVEACIRIQQGAEKGDLEEAASSLADLVQAYDQLRRILEEAREA